MIIFKLITELLILNLTNALTWSTMPSSDESTVGCISLCNCIIFEQRHMGSVALMEPVSLPVEPPLDDDAGSLTLLVPCYQNTD